ncbi:GTPase ObgE [Candidatus Omnitrophus magneticus]|uniref:GTPase Obg n=1 Tax=Candidatus Omnitrophus magneticus TaxID=1609969 RepID=A0A0F0CPW3_9BACT|nr:GTPase ObgE [Candidatus Omnitrophus magneticus]
MLIDSAKIYVQAGTGGNGCNSFFKDIFNRKGIPDGGNGGDGGNVVLIGDSNLQTLLDFRYNQHYKAEDAGHGGSNHKQGRRGKDLVVKVPPGTIIRDEANGLLIRDIAKAGDSVIVARGGSGGKGNTKWREASHGAFGEERTLLLELKLVADAGIIGLPNAGKSTLVSKISNSHTKIADYPFTTKSPNLGVVKFHDNAFIIADMPGLIEGAHSGRGLGDKFLKHIERTSVLVHLVDMCPIDGTDPIENYKKIENEIKLYSSVLSKKPKVVVAGKMDLSGAMDALARFKKNIRKKVIPISALNNEGLDSLVIEIYGKVKNAKEKSEENNS